MNITSNDVTPLIDKAYGKRGPLITAEQRKNERLNVLGSIYQRTNRIITDDAVVVEVSTTDYVNAVAWTDGEKITINSRQVDDVDAFTAEKLHGVNFHELAHVMYTPRRGTSLVIWVLDNDKMNEFNILEDQRIEALLTARYPSIAPWLTTAILRWVLNNVDKSDNSTAYLWVRGRTYLPGALRGNLRTKFERQDLLPDVDRIIDSYRSLVFPTDYQRAIELIEEFSDLMSKLSPSGLDTTPDPYGHGNRPVDIVISGRPKSVKEQRSAQDKVIVGEVEDLGEDDDDDDTDGRNDKPSIKTSSKPSSDADVDGTDSSAGQGVGTNTKSNTRRIAEEMLQEILEDPKVAKEIQRTLREIRTGGGADTLQPSQWQYRTALPQYVGMYQSMRRTLSRLMRDADPGWYKRENTGRINATRWMQEKDLDTAYDRWDEGANSASSLEVVILLDESGSMSSQYEEAANAMWVVKRSLDQIGASTTVITFDAESRMLYSRKDRATGQVRYSFRAGGTDPVMGLRQAALIFSRSTKTQKILIVFTDGDWSLRNDEDGVNADGYMRRMSRGGVLTALGYITDPSAQRSRINSHGAHISSAVQGAGLFKFMNTIVTSSIKAHINR